MRPRTTADIAISSIILYNKYLQQGPLLAVYRLEKSTYTMSIDLSAEQRVNIERHITLKTYTVGEFFKDASKPPHLRVVTASTLEHHLQALRHSNELRVNGKPITRDQLILRLREQHLTKQAIDLIDDGVVKALGLKVS